MSQIAKKRVKATAAVQAELLKEFQELSQHWITRAKSETDLASELISRLTSAHLVPEVAKAYQEWAGRRMQMAFEDGQRLVADGFKLMEAATRRFSDGSADIPS